MRQLLAAEIRGSWVAWLSVLATFVAANFALGLSLLQYDLGRSYPWPDPWEEGPQILVIGGGFNLAASILTSLAVIGAAAGLVVSSRRGALARLALAGASPGQVLRTVLTQLAVVSLAGAVIGDALAVALFHPYLVAEAAEREWATVPPATWSLTSLLWSSALCVVVAIVGGWRQARVGTRVPPVEALRQSQGAPQRRPGVGRWIATALLVGLVGFGVAAMKGLGESDNPGVRSSILQTAMLLLLLAGVTLATAAPLSVAAITRAWTSLIPGGVAWHLARRTVIAKADRLVKSVVPVMFAVGLLTGMVGIAATLNATLAASGSSTQLDHVSLFSTLNFVGLPLVIAVAGGLSALLMMGRQRDAELALAGIVGATPAQRILVPIMEAVIVSVTAFLLGIAMMGTGIASLLVALAATPGAKVAVGIPWADLAIVMGATTVLTIAATTLPTLPALRQPAPEVVARLIAT
ncbi:MAG TPA: hypothetical protein DEG88_00840 [Propionibacteriaceae bacterium]|nr:hypothetical protein [Micropruina sp.]HBX80169.1 hypothetical protein [Propionibacteriaceae bacterium]HBY21882.1 hypothetical protein [Propionibacteriaceae bacterium]